MWWPALGERAMRAEHPRALVSCVGVLGSPLTHSCLIVFIGWSERVILVCCIVRIASSGTRCSSCKPVVLVTFIGCHLLDGLVA
jgi:predicted membrane protein